MVLLVKTSEELKEQFKNAGDKLVVIDFFATWCGPCKVISPKLEEHAKKYADKLVVVKIDVDESEDLAVEYGISSMPTFVFIKNGEKVEEFSGANNEKLEKLIIQYIG